MSSPTPNTETSEAKPRHRRRTTLAVIGLIFVVAVVVAIVLGVTLGGRDGNEGGADAAASNSGGDEAPAEDAGYNTGDNDGSSNNGNDGNEDESDAGESPDATKGLSASALAELRDLGLFSYVGLFAPKSSTTEGVLEGHTLHTFDNADGQPVCIAGTEMKVLTREGADPTKLLIFLQGGGACWQDFYNCIPFADMVIPTGSDDEDPLPGIWEWDNPSNPFRDHSLVYLPYCDGSGWLGDNDVDDPGYGESLGFPFITKRYHRGIRNLSAGMDLAKAMFPDATQITVAGTSAGGLGAAVVAPFFVRELYGNVDLTVLNDAGPVVENLAEAEDVEVRVSDWGLGALIPPSCEDCDLFGQAGTALIRWRLDNDGTVRDAIYQTDADLTNRFYLRLDSPSEQPIFRDLIVSEHGKLNEAYPERFKQFIVSNDTSHGALQTDLFYRQEANGEVFNDWVKQFIEASPSWGNIVEG